ncbi:MAG: alkane 1-monooxygenase [Maritimibacter sp.]|nr:alkane 1-monooxygenase [Maritimibacter sp.]
MVPYSVLDLSPVPAGKTPADALANSVDLAQNAETWGYNRYWLAEHHNMTGIASAATSLVISHVAANTKTIRVGAGGIMLPNHSPLVIAEQFGTLATLYPGRIDLGLGRAPGTDMGTARALRRGMGNNDDFPNDVVELMSYLGPEQPDARVRAVPGTGTEVPVWMLGSSLYGAQLAAHLGLPYAFASHFAPGYLQPALETYRSSYRPSEAWPEPHFMLAINVFAADTDEEGARLRTSMQQTFLNLRRGRPGPLPAPVDTLDATADELAGVNEALMVSAVGSKDSVRARLDELIGMFKPDEVILTGQIHDHDARVKSFGMAADILG